MWSVGSTLCQIGGRRRPSRRVFDRLLEFWTPLRACKTRCRRLARRAAAGCAAVLVLLANRTTTLRVAMAVCLAFASFASTNRLKCVSHASIIERLVGGSIPPTSLTPGCLTTSHTPEPPPTGPISRRAAAPRRGPVPARHTRTTGPGRGTSPPPSTPSPRGRAKPDQYKDT